MGFLSDFFEVRVDSSASNHTTTEYYSTDFGDSWGYEMPDEPNQYNYPGDYTQYFEDIFKNKLGSFRMEKKIEKYERTVYTFWNSDNMVLVIELLPETSAAKKVRSDCERDDIPYLRFYHNHFGWWNTRSYVEKRIDKALN